MLSRAKNLMRFWGLIALVAVLAVQCTPPPATQAPAPTSVPASTEESAPSATTAPAQPEEELADVQVLRFGIQEEDCPAGFDPIKTTTSPGMDLQKEIYNGLVRLRPDGESYADLEPDLAERWEVSSDNLVWTFYLRQGVQFQKGFGEMTADDVVFTLNRARAKGASWAADFAAITNVEALDKYTVRITCSHPDPYFLYKLSNSSDVAGVIVSKKAVEQYGDDFAFNPIGTGPFQFESYSPKQKVVLVPNPDYFRGKPILDRLEYLFIPELQTQSMALKAGELDMMRGDMTPDYVAEMEAAGMNVMLGVRFALPLMFNLTIKPFDDIRVRQAVRYAIDTQAFADYFGSDFVFVDKPTYSVWPSFQPVYKAAAGQAKEYPYDPEKAKQLLAEAGYPDGFSVDLTWTNQMRFRVPMEIVQAQLAKVGIKINLNIVEHAVYREVIDGEGQAMAMISVSRETPDAVALQWFSSDSIPPYGKTAKYNYAHYGEAIPGVDDLIAKATAEIDPAKAIQYYVEMQKKIAEDLPMICLYQGASEPYVTAPYVDMGYQWNAPDRRYPTITETARILKH